MIRKTIIVVLTLAAMATSYVWVDSYTWQLGDWWGGDFYHMRGSRVVLAIDQNHSAMVGWTSGHIAIVYTAFPPPAEGAEFQFSYGLNRLWDYRESKPKSCFRSLSGPSNALSYFWLAFPVWAPFVCFAAYPTFAFVRGPLRRSLRRRRGECTGCGYDLTGNESGVCPECGTEVKA